MKVNIKILKELKETIKNNESIERIDIDYIIDRLATKRSWSFETMYDFLYNLKKINKAAYCSLILKETAIYLDSKYDGNIKEINQGWYISLVDGLPGFMKLEYEPKGFAIFRTLKDTMAAWYMICDDIIKLYE